MEEIRDVHFGWIRNYDVQFLPKRDKKCDTEYIQCGVVGLRRNLFNLLFLPKNKIRKHIFGVIGPN